MTAIDIDGASSRARVASSSPEDPGSSMSVSSTSISRKRSGRDSTSSCGMPNALAPAPFTTYFADAKLPYIDLNDAETLGLLGLLPTDLHSSWRSGPSPTRTQLLGLAVSRQKRFAAIRYPSDAAKAEKKTGANYVIYYDSIAPPAELTQ